MVAAGLNTASEWRVVDDLCGVIRHSSALCQSGADGKPSEPLDVYLARGGVERPEYALCSKALGVIKLRLSPHR
jgi:hypothetical protein